MGITRRGRATVGVAVAAVAMGWTFGSRSLNAVAVTALVALAVGTIQLRLAEAPTVERSVPRPGFPGETRSITLSLSGSRGTIVEVTDELGAGLSSTGNVLEGTVPFEQSYEVTLAERGRHSIGPVTVRVRDALGVLEREYDLGETDSMLVYPSVYDVAGSETLAAVVRRTRTADRQEIDRLREYVSGDPLRDIAWKASAKRAGEFVVVEYAGQEPTGTVELAASSNREATDEATSALASIALFLLDMGLDVGITVPDGRIEPATGRRHRHEVLRVLAETGPGSIPDRTWTEADVRAVGESGGVTVDTETRTVAFETIRSGDRILQFADRFAGTTPDHREVAVP